MSERWHTDKWFVSPFNFSGEVTAGASLPKSLTIHDVTLRDGEQQAGVFFTKEEKLRVAKLLDRARVDEIEVGSPGIYQQDMEAIRELVAASLDAKLFAWCRNQKRDIAAAKECGSWGVTIELPASSIMIDEIYSTNLDEMASTVAENVDYAKSEGLHVTLLLVDSTRSDLRTLERIVKEICRPCASIALSDTFGVAIPQAVAYLVRKAREWTDKPVSIHCHNDFGLATANTLAAVAAGASSAHVTVNTLGERAGNTSLGEVALGAKLLMGVDVNLKLDELYRLSKTVGDLSGFKVPPNKPIVGSNVFNVESAQSALWFAKSEKGIYAFPFSRDLIGHPELKMTLSKKSGPLNLKMKIAEFGLEIDESRYPEILGKIYEKSIEKNGPLTDDEFLGILEDLGLYKFKQEDLMRA